MTQKGSQSWYPTLYTHSSLRMVTWMQLFLSINLIYATSPSNSFFGLVFLEIYIQIKAVQFLQRGRWKVGWGDSRAEASAKRTSHQHLSSPELGYQEGYAADTTAQSRICQSPTLDHPGLMHRSLGLRHSESASLGQNLGIHSFTPREPQFHAVSKGSLQYLLSWLTLPNFLKGERIQKLPFFPQIVPQRNSLWTQSTRQLK